MCLMESVICSAEVADDHVAKFTSLLRARVPKLVTYFQNLQSLVNGAILVFPQYSVSCILIQFFLYS